MGFRGDRELALPNEAQYEGARIVERGGPSGTRSDDLLNAISALFQVSYGLLGELCLAATQRVGVGQVEGGPGGVGGREGIHVEEDVGVGGRRAAPAHRVAAEHGAPGVR